jgi:hypothetical protein
VADGFVVKTSVAIEKQQLSVREQEETGRWGGQVTKGGGVDILVYIGLWDAAFKKPVRFIIPWSAIDIPTKNPILL